jgi:hypothetical protein
MTLKRYTFLTLTLLAGFALLITSANAQDALPKRPDTNLINEARDSRGIPKAELPRFKPDFDKFAKYYADFVSHPLVYRAIQDPTKLPAGITKDQLSIDEKIKELELRYLLEPNPAVRETTDATEPKVNSEKADYIRELGIAFDAALKPLIENHPDRIVRVNAMRLYAAVCRTGAAAHWPTVTALLTNPNTPTEVKYYALQAAANLLSAGDVFDYKSRRHSIGSKQPPAGTPAASGRAAADKEIGELVKAIEECIVNPNAVLTDLRDGKIENITADQVDVVRFVRRQAIKALGQVRFITLPGPKEQLYPAVTLIRICMSDPTIYPAPTPSECAEAVIGLCNMAPVWDGAPVKGFDPDTLAEAVTTGLITFATPRAVNAQDRSLPWRGYAVRINDAFKTWRPLFDPLFEPTQPGKFDTSKTPKVIADLITRTQTAILIPMEKEKGETNIDLEPLKTYLRTLQEKPNRTGLLIKGIPQTALPAPPKK